MVKRYYIDLESAQYGGNFKQFDLMIEDADGEFVTHSDYAALLHRAEAAEKERDKYKVILEQIVKDYHTNLQFVEDARAALKEGIK
jgi:hypothetical protein